MVIYSKKHLNRNNIWQVITLTKDSTSRLISFFSLFHVSIKPNINSVYAHHVQPRRPIDRMIPHTKNRHLPPHTSNCDSVRRPCSGPFVKFFASDCLSNVLCEECWPFLQSIHICVLQSVFCILATCSLVLSCSGCTCWA